MSWLRRLLGSSSERDPGSRSPNYLAEALDLEQRGDLANALTSYRLALRERPDDPRILQNIAIAFSRSGQPEEAIRAYRRALDIEPSLDGAHYGLAFLLLRRGDHAAAAAHLEAFLRVAPHDDDTAARFRAHAERTLAGLRGETDGPDDVRAGDDDERDHEQDGTGADGAHDGISDVREAREARAAREDRDARGGATGRDPRIDRPLGRAADAGR